MKLFSPSLNRKISEYEEFINQFAEKLMNMIKLEFLLIKHQTQTP